MLLRYIPKILFEPKRAFEDAREIDNSAASVITGLLIPLALIAPIAALLGTTLLGWSIGNGSAVKLSYLSAGKISCAYFIGIVATTIVVSRFIQWMSSTYGSPQSFRSSLILAVLAAVPLYLCGIFQAYPVIWVNYLIGLPILAYSIYLLFTGLRVFFGIEKHRVFLFAAAIMALGMVSIVALLAITVLLWDSGITPEYS